MPRRDLPPKIRAIVMQSLLVLVFGATVGLAALVTRHVRSSMRVEMGDPRTVGGITVAFPAGWANASLSGEREELAATEPDRGFGRTLRVVQQRAQGMVSPLEHLIRSNQIKPDVLRSLAERREGFALQNVSVGGWPGQMLTVPPRPGAPEKAVIACAVLPAAKAVVVGLQGSEPLDVSDVELVRQVCEHTTIATMPKTTLAAPAGPIKLVDEISVNAPPQYLEATGSDENELQKHLVYDGTRGGGGGGWVGIDLTSCVFFAEDRDESLLAMLAARDVEWRGGPVRRLGPRTWVVDRPAAPEVTGSASAGAAGGGGAASFPSRAYLSANVDGRALLVVMHGGPRDARLFDAAWQAIAASLKFDGTKDLSSLLVNGTEAAGRLGGGRLAELLPRDPGEADGGAEAWYLWDAWANAGQELWTKFTWHAAMKDGAWESLAGTRASDPVAAYAGETRFEQTWSAAADLSTYQVTTSREVTRGSSARSRTRFEQRVSVDHGRMTLAVDVGTSLPDVAGPPQFVPGAIVPLVMRELAERPALIRTESFAGIETVAPGGLLTLFVTRLADAPPRLDDSGEPMECVTVGVNGTGVVSRWYYTAGDGEPGSHELRFIDFAGGLKAAAGGGR